MTTGTYKRTDLELTKIKNDKSLELQTFYRRTINTLNEWDECHSTVENQSNALRYRIKSAMQKAKETVSSWKRETVDTIISDDWKNIIATHQKWCDIMYAYFNVIEYEYDDYLIIVEDLFNLNISPKPYLTVNLKTGKPKEISPDEAITQMLSKYAKKTTEYYERKNERDRIIVACQTDENKRHGNITKTIQNWRSSHKEYDAIGTWMECIEQLAHARIYNLISLLSTTKSVRDEQLAHAHRLAEGCSADISSLIGEFAKLITAKDELEKQKQKEREQKEREAEEAAEAERKRLEHEAEVKRDADKTASMLGDLVAKFNTPKKNQNNNKIELTITDSKPEQTKSETKMTKSKKFTKRDIKAQPVPQEDLIIKSDADELVELILDKFDINKSNHFCVQGVKIIFSKQLSEMLCNNGYTWLSLVEQGGNLFLVFRRNKGIELDLEEEDGTFFCSVESAKYASKILSATSGDAQYQEYRLEAGINKKQDYMYAKITSKEN